MRVVPTFRLASVPRMIPTEDYEQMVSNNTKFTSTSEPVLDACARGGCPVLDFRLDASLSSLRSHLTSSLLKI